MPDGPWPYLPTLVRLVLALALGLFVGLERERRGKEAGVRTFAFASLLGCLGGCSARCSRSSPSPASSS